MGRIMATVKHDIEHYLSAARELAPRVAANADRIDSERQVLGFDSLSGLSMDQAIDRVERRIKGIIYFPITFNPD